MQLQSVLIVFLSSICVVFAQFSNPFVTCGRDFMEICFDESQNVYHWADGNDNGILDQDGGTERKDSCASYSKDGPNNTQLTCASTMYHKKYFDEPIVAEGVTRYECANTQEASKSNPNLLKVTNRLSQESGSISIGDKVRYTVGCAFNLLFEDVEVVLRIPELDTKFTTDVGEFNTDLKMCTDRECTAWYALPGAATETDNSYVLQTTTVGAQVYPRLQNCWASPDSPVKPTGGLTPHPAQFQLVTDFCATPDGPLTEGIEIVVWEENGKDEVRLIVPSFSFVGAQDADGNDLEFTYIMCEATIGLTPELGVTGDSKCHRNGKDSRRQLSTDIHKHTWMNDRQLLENLETATVGTNISVKDAKVAIKGNPGSNAACMSVFAVFTLMFLGA